MGGDVQRGDVYPLQKWVSTVREGILLEKLVVLTALKIELKMLPVGVGNGFLLNFLQQRYEVAQTARSAGYQGWLIKVMDLRTQPSSQVRRKVSTGTPCLLPQGGKVLVVRGELGLHTGWGAGRARAP